MFKRVSIFLLALLLIVGNFTYVSAGSGPTVKTLPETLEKKGDNDKLKQTEDPDKEVRVVVELSDPSPIEKATQKGVTFNSLKETEKQQLEKQSKVKQKTMKSKINSINVMMIYLQGSTTLLTGSVLR